MALRFIVSSLVLLWSTTVQAERYALIIAVGDYPDKSGWADLNVGLDVQQMKGALIHHAFDTDNIQVLRDAGATKDQILKAFEKLEKQLKPEDIVFVHYSGHGQQITDVNGDEGDGLDEAICPYDSRPRFKQGVYAGECHILDDEVQTLLKSLSDKVGAKGEVIYAVDACHSGSGVRGPKKRGADSAFVIPGHQAKGLVAKAKDQNFLETEIPANLVAFFGSASGEANYQVWYTHGQQMGSLSFALANALKALSERSSYQDLEREVHRIVQQKTRARQNPSHSGNLHKRVFQGYLSVSNNYFKVTRVETELVTVNASLFEGVGDGSQLAFCPPDVDEYNKEQVWAIGKVIKADYAWCQVVLSKPLEKEQLYKAHVFVAKRNYHLKPIAVAVSCTNKALADEITKQLNEFNTLVRVDAESPFLIFSDSTKVEDIKEKEMFKGSHYAYLSKDMNALDRAEKIRYKLIDYLIAQYLLEQTAQNPTLQAKVELINPETGEAYEMKDSIYHLSENNKFKIKVSNVGRRPFFFNLLYVQSDGLSGQLEPRIGDGHLEPSECQVQPYDALTTEYVFTATEPFGRDVLVVLLENDEVNTQPKLDNLWFEIEDIIQTEKSPMHRGNKLMRKRRGLSRQEGATIFQVVIEVKGR